MEERYGRIRVSPFQFYICGGESWDFEGTEQWPAASLLKTGKSLVTVASKTDTSAVGLRAVTHESEPDARDLNEWERAEEVSVTFDGDPDPYFLVPFQNPGAGLDSDLEDFYIAPGSWRVRAYVRGSQQAYEMGLAGTLPKGDDIPSDPSALPEQFLIDFWPVTSLDPARVLKD